MEGGSGGMLAAVTNALTQMITWLGDVVESIATEAGSLGALLPLFALGVAATVVMFGVKIIRSFTWGA